MAMVDILIDFVSKAVLLYFALKFGNKSLNEYQAKKDLKGVISEFIREINKLKSKLANHQLQMLRIESKGDQTDYDELLNNEVITGNIMKTEINSLIYLIQLEFREIFYSGNP